MYNFLPVALSANSSLSGVAITSDMLSPLVDGVTGNVAVILPVGITIFAILLGISLVPKIIRQFGAK